MAHDSQPRCKGRPIASPYRLLESTGGRQVSYQFRLVVSRSRMWMSNYSALDYYGPNNMTAIHTVDLCVSMESISMYPGYNCQGIIHESVWETTSTLLYAVLSLPTIDTHTQFHQVSVFAFFTPNRDFNVSYDTNRIAFCGTTLSVLAAHPL